jgi:hypothetical protein
VKAARIHSFGPPDVVVIEDVPVPSPGPGEVLVRVMAGTRSSVRGRARSARNLRSPSVRTSPVSSRRSAPALRTSRPPTKSMASPTRSSVAPRQSSLSPRRG